MLAKVINSAIMPAMICQETRIAPSRADKLSIRALE